MNYKDFLEKRNNENVFQDLICTKCEKEYHNARVGSVCPLCFTSLISKDENVPTCPTCKSKNVSTISSSKRVIHGVAFGILSKTARSQFRCNKCGYMW